MGLVSRAEEMATDTVNEVRVLCWVALSIASYSVKWFLALHADLDRIALEALLKTDDLADNGIMTGRGMSL